MGSPSRDTGQGGYNLLACCGSKPPRPPTQLEQLEVNSGSVCTPRMIIAAASAALLLVGTGIAAWVTLGPNPGASSAPAPPNSIRPTMAITALTEDHHIGRTDIKVASDSEFSKGDNIEISNGDEYAEVKKVVGLGSIVLDSPLEHDYPAGSKVKKLQDNASRDDVESHPDTSNVDSASYGSQPITFYFYRASGDVHYPLENVNVGDLAGVMWYLHNEIIPAPVRKYGIDRIKRYKIKLRPVVEFWNVHHVHFGPFMAYDAAMCTTPDCGKVYKQYGYIVGCQPVTPGRSGYEATEDTLPEKMCSNGDISCRSPMWYSMPGACPLKKLKASNLEYTQNVKGVDVQLSPDLTARSEDEEKSDECIANEPGGRCDDPTGAPDCVYAVEEAGEILLDELVGITPNFNEWYINISVTREYSGETDKGIGCSWWDGRQDKDKCMDRLRRAMDMFEQKWGIDPDITPGQPICDFDGWYDKEEFIWERNHTGAVEPSRGFIWEESETVV